MRVPKSFEQGFLWAFLVLMLVIFVGMRLFKLESSLLFFNDIGRDFAELEEWRVTGLPPLLGPQTSALPFNQSAFYFYVLYPGYLLSGLSPFSSVYTLLVFYAVLMIGFFAWFMKKGKKTWAWAVLIITALVTLYPQAVIQNRFVWNPSFAFPSAIVALMAWLWGRKQWSWWAAGIWGIASAAAISFSYSLAPLFIVLLVLTPFVYWHKKIQWLWLWGSSFVADLFFNLPTFAFELRHDFTLTRLMLYGEKLPQSGLEWSMKVPQLFHYLTGSDQNDIAVIILVAFLLAVGFGVYSWQSRKLFEARNTSLLTFSIFALTFFITLVVPVSVQAHYIFGLVASALVTLAFLPKRISGAFVLIAAAAWLQPQTLNIYYKPAFRTVDQMLRCFQQVCQVQGKEPLYVSVQAGFHPFHNGQEHRYLLTKAGCQVKAIEREPNAAKNMAVVVDSSVYEHNKTAYNELTLYGPSKVKQEFNCQDNFQVILLESIDK